MADKNRIIIFDTTMRDGEQSPGASMSLEEKIQISRVFDELGIDVIEAGFPIASPGDFEAVNAISKILKKSIPAGLATTPIWGYRTLTNLSPYSVRSEVFFLQSTPLTLADNRCLI